MFRVIIAGGRDFDDYQLLKATMDKLLCNITDEITVVCGQAKGADTLGEQYAMEKGYAIDYYPAIKVGREKNVAVGLVSVFQGILDNPSGTVKI